MKVKVDAESLLKEANSYTKIAANSLKGKSKFNKEFIFNIVSMSFEKYMVAFLGQKGVMPRGHSYTNLLEDIEPYQSITPGLLTSLLKFERTEDICTIATAPKIHFTDAEMVEMVTLLQELKKTLFPELNQNP